MFGLLGKKDYSNKCINILNKDTGLDPLIAQAFIEDFKEVFDEQYSIHKDIEQTLINSGHIILKSIVDEVVRDIKTGNKCRIYEKVAVKINQWSLTKLDDNNLIIDSIEKCLVPFIKKT